MNKYPIFIPSKGRADTRLTMKALDRINVDYRVVVEEYDADKYAAVLGERRLVVMPQHDQGLVVTRNWLWDYARDHGFKRYWTMDDNISGFYRFNRNLKVRVGNGKFLVAMEEFTERYTNVIVSGMNYHMFVWRKDASIKPFTPNTRVYSNMLIDTMAYNPAGKPYRNEGFFNDDTDLCLRILKDGNCTILFNAFLIEKSTTMTVSGGMTPHYQGDGRWKMAEELRRKHPDVTIVTKKWGRWQHHVDYRRFRKNRLKKRTDIEIPTGVNDFGMKLKVSQ